MAFGELALMYNAPRAASITAKTSCTCWCLDRVTFKNVVMSEACRTRDDQLDFVNRVSLFDNLSRFERLRIVEAIHIQNVAAGKRGTHWNTHTHATCTMKVRYV